MGKITIVPHCWAANHVHYATMLRAQLTSIERAPPNSQVHVAVCCNPTDKHTMWVIADFLSCESFRLRPILLPQKDLWRRCIGRNLAALSDKDSDVIWFADCDYVFREGALDFVLQEFEKSGRPNLMWPSKYLTNLDKEPVDRWLKEYENPVLRKLEPPITNYGYKSNGKAIGGLQIVSGEYARKNGYINKSKWMKFDGDDFANTTCDVKFRKMVLKTGSYHEIEEIPGLVRLRHTEVAF